MGQIGDWLSQHAGNIGSTIGSIGKYLPFQHGGLVFEGNHRIHHKGHHKRKKSKK